MSTFDEGQHPPPVPKKTETPAFTGYVVRCSFYLALWLGGSDDRYRLANAARSPDRYIRYIPTDSTHELFQRIEPDAHRRA